MKVRDSGMPNEGTREAFFDPDATLAALAFPGTTADIVDFGCGYGIFTIAAALRTSGTVYAADIDPISSAPNAEISLVRAENTPADRLPEETKKFLAWFEKPGDTDPLLIAGLAHLWFVTIHPFDDGNGRIARAISDMALARSEGTGQRFYSIRAADAAPVIHLSDKREEPP